MQDSKEYYDMLLRTHQIDLNTLERGRLEDLCQSLIDGHLVILDVFMSETRQSAVIATQQAMLAQLNDALATANTTLAADSTDHSNYVLEMLVTIATHVYHTWTTDKEEALTGLFLGIYQCLQKYPTLIEPELLDWWRDLIRTPPENTSEKAVEEEDEDDDEVSDN